MNYTIMGKNSHTPPGQQESKPKAPHLLFGETGEQLAGRILQNNGYEILARNWRYGRLEIDLICKKDDLIVFVEVKTRRTTAYGGGVAAINKGKKRRLIQGAQIWLQRNNACCCPCRFDILCLTGQGESFQMEHYQNAIEISASMDCGNFAWQSW